MIDVGQKKIMVRWIIYASLTWTLSAYTSFPIRKRSTHKLYNHNSNRNIETLQSWAHENDIKTLNGFTLKDDDDTGDWSVSISQNGTKDLPILQIPSRLILSSFHLRKEISVPTSVLNDLKQKKIEHQIPQFYLWLKILKEYEKGSESLWYPWLKSLPDRFTNAIAMDDIEIECLAPFAWSLAKMQKLHLQYFNEGLDEIPDIKIDDANAREWAFMVVFTRAWWNENDDGVDIVPVGDMFNHEHPDNVHIQYDENNNCQVYLKDDVSSGSKLTLSYGLETNPYRFMVLYGFFDSNQEFIFSQMIVDKPSQKHVDLGYDTTKMVISTKDGTLSQENWDVLLYSILEQIPDVQQTFYQAHIDKNQIIKDSIQKQYYLETCIILKKHIDQTLKEMKELLQKIDQQDMSQHQLLPMIRDSNIFVYQSFSKAKNRIDLMIQNEMKLRKTNAIS